MVAGSGLEHFAQPARAHNNPLENSENPQSKNDSTNAKLFDSASDPKGLLQDAVYRPNNVNTDSFLPKVDWGDQSNGGDATVQLARALSGNSAAANAGKLSNEEFVRRAVNKAEQLEGQKLWVNTPYSDIVGNGEFGCAASLGRFLNSIGERVKPSPLALGLKNNLLATHNWTASPYKNDDIAPGSVIFGTKAGRAGEVGGGASHIALVVGRKDGQLMVADNNAKLGGKWDIRPLTESFPPDRYKYEHLQVLQRKSR